MKIKSLLYGILSLGLLFSLSACNNDTPYIGENGNWWVGDNDLGVQAQGPQGEKGDKGDAGEAGTQGEKGDKVSITIGGNGNWYIDGKDTNVKARGESGKTPVIKIGDNGNWLVDGKDSGVHAQGEKGDISSITIGDNGNWFIDGTDSGVKAQGDKGEAGDTPEIKIGENGNWFVDGKDTGVKAQGETGAEGEQGPQGNSPYVGANGNWWVGEEDTGIVATPDMDDRVISDGLQFDIVTRGNKAGMQVIAYNGTDTDVVIPNYVGYVPVISIAEAAFQGNSSITSVSLSKNIVNIEREAFYNCKSLSNVDFNGCEITEIPYGCFYGSGIREMTLPETVTKLGEKAFYGSKLNKINYENITSFGDYCFNDVVTDYFYLDDNVETVGFEAFGDNIVYTKHKTLPDTWNTNILDDYSDFRVRTNVINTPDYVYSKELDGITLYQMKNTTNVVNVPSEIDGTKVKRIGEGFAYNRFGAEEEKYAKAKDQIVLPDTVESIDAFTMDAYGTMYYLPKSVRLISKNSSIIATPNFILFEDSQFVNTTSGFIEDGNQQMVPSASELESTNLGYKFDCKYDNLMTEDNIHFYYKNLVKGSFIASMDYFEKDIVVKNKISNVSIDSIERRAIMTDAGYSLTIEDGISKIRTKAINGEFKYIKVPSSVDIVNKNAIKGYNTYLLLEDKKLNPDWDSAFQTGCEILFDAKDAKYKGGYIYKESLLGTKLIRFIGNRDEELIPYEIDGKKVTTIATGCFTQTRGSVYIPKNITTIESNAFNIYSTTYFHSEAKEKPSGWAADWYGNSSYVYLYWNEALNIKYYISGNYGYGEGDGYVFFLNNLGTDKILKLPRKLDGKTITAIADGFYSPYATEIYVPKTIVLCDGYTFGEGTSDKIKHIYFEADTLPKDFTKDTYQEVHLGTKLDY